MATVITPNLKMQQTMPLLAGDSGLTCFLNKLGGQFGIGTFTLTGQPANNDTFTIGTKTYKYQTSLTEEDGNIKIGDAIIDTAIHSIFAIELGINAGADYAAATTINTDVRAVSGGTGKFIAISKQAGPTANSIGTTSSITGGNGSWATTTLINGVDFPAAQDNDFTLTLPTNPANGTNFTFVSKDNGQTTVNGEDYFTNWKIDSPVADGFVIRKGNKLLITTPTDNQPFTSESVIFGFSGNTQNSQRDYDAGEILTVTFRDGKWFGEIPADSNILGIGAI